MKRPDRSPFYWILRNVTRPSGPWDPPVSVWTEAAARAAKMLRAMKREKAGQK